MLINIFSDSHLTHWFSKNKYDQIKQIAENCDQVIINGDFWDHYRTTFDKFIRSKYKTLFPLLKKKNCIYIYGNHDDEVYSDTRIYEFCEKAVQFYDFETEFGKFHLVHGDKLAPTPKLDILKKLLGERLANQAGFMILVTGHTFFHNLFFEYVYRPYNKIMKEWKESNMDPNIWLVTGHSHYAEVDKENKYANCGMNHIGKFQYLQVNTNEKSAKGIKLIAL